MVETIDVRDAEFNADNVQEVTERLCENETVLEKDVAKAGDIIAYGDQAYDRDGYIENINTGERSGLVDLEEVCEMAKDVLEDEFSQFMDDLRDRATSIHRHSAVTEARDVGANNFDAIVTMRTPFAVYDSLFDSFDVRYVESGEIEEKFVTEEKVDAVRGRTDNHGLVHFFVQYYDEDEA